jgi:hypothetical protein
MIGPSEALLCAAISDFAWFRDAAAGFELEVAAAGMASMRLAGPSAHAALQALKIGGEGVAIALPGLPPALVDLREQGHADIWCDAADAMALANLLSRQGVRPVGARAVDAWRVQAGLAQAGADWTPVQTVLDLSQARRIGELSGPLGSHYLAEVTGSAAVKGLTSIVDWPPSAQTFGIGWSLLGQFQEPGPGIRFHRAAATD